MKYNRTAARGHRAFKMTAARSRPTLSPAEEDGLKVAEHLARAFEAMIEGGVSNRDVFNQVIRAAVVGNPTFLGAWCVFEPDSIEGPDVCFTGAQGHDATGRFAVYWNRAEGDLRLDPVTGLDRPEHASWYSVPMELRQPCTTEPYVYPVGGRARWLASAVAPVNSRGKCIGVVGADWSVMPVSSEPSDDPTQAVLHASADGKAAERLHLLTARQNEVYFWLSQGKSNEEIGIILGISAHTVKNHVDHIFQKLGVSNRLAAAMITQGSF